MEWCPNGEQTRFPCKAPGTGRHYIRLGKEKFLLARLILPSPGVKPGSFRRVNKYYWVKGEWAILGKCYPIFEHVILIKTKIKMHFSTISIRGYSCFSKIMIFNKYEDRLNITEQILWYLTHQKQPSNHTPNHHNYHHCCHQRCMQRKRSDITCKMFSSQSNFHHPIHQ